MAASEEEQAVSRLNTGPFRFSLYASLPAAEATILPVGEYSVGTFEINPSKSEFTVPTKTAVEVPLMSCNRMPECWMASTASSSSMRCWGSVYLASSVGTLKK